MPAEPLWVGEDNERLHPSAPAFISGELNTQRRFFEEGRCKFKQTYLCILISFAYVRACKPVCKFRGIWIISELPLQLRSCFKRAAPASAHERAEAGLELTCWWIRPSRDHSSDAFPVQHILP